MSTPRVAALFVHPLKSAAAVPVSALPLDARGAVGDRRWMLVDANDVAITQRETHTLALVQPVVRLQDGALVDDGTLTLRAPACADTLTARIDVRAMRRRVTIWDDVVDVDDAGDEAAAWCQRALGVVCRLVRLADGARRALQPKYAGPLPFESRDVPLSDGAPLLLLSQGSIDHLAERLVAQGGEPVGVDRFRPNVLLTGTAPHDEDTWSRVRMGDVEFGVGSPCPRCVMTTVDQQTAAGGVEPLRTLATYRRADDGKVMFGMNATHAGPGVIRTGDAVEVLQRRHIVVPV